MAAELREFPPREPVRGRTLVHAADRILPVNRPADTRLSAIEGLYRKAWESGCKGITVFREGSRASVLERDESEGPHPTGTGSPAGVCTFCDAPTTEDPRAGG